MADIAAQPFINYGLSQAQQGQAQASANLQGQQAQAAAMQNKITAARLPFIMKMYEQMNATSDTSGVDGHGMPGGPLAAKDEGIADNGFDAADITAKHNQRYTVPEWTPQERQQNLQAAGSGNEDAVKFYAMQRQQRLDTLRQRSKYDALNEYKKYAASALAASSYSSLKQSDPNYIKWLDKQTDDTGAPLSQDAKETSAKGYARYQAADLHSFTGRKVKQIDGQNVDEDDGLPVAGVPDLHMSPKDSAQFIKDAQTPSIEISTGVPGQTKKIAPWQVTHARSVHDYLAGVEQGAYPSPEKINAMTAGKPLSANDLANLRTTMAHDGITNAAQGNAPLPYKPSEHPAPDPSNPGAPAPMPKHPPKQQVPQDGQPAAVPSQGQPAPAAGASGPAPAAGPQPAPAAPKSKPSGAPFQGTETLDGVDSNKLPKYTAPVNATGVTASTQQGLDLAAQNKEKYRQMDLANQHLRQNATERGLLDQAQNEVDKLRNDPRAVGPGSHVTTLWNEFRSYATGKAPDPLTERKMFDKVLLQLGAANVKQAFDNQSRIGQQEYMKLLTEGNPTGAMPLDAIQKLVNFARYNNEFSTRVTNTRVDALNKGADPYSRPYNNLDQGRSSYVQTRMGADGKKDPYEVGKLYPGEGGSKARYKGKGQWARE